MTWLRKRWRLLAASLLLLAASGVAIAFFFLHPAHKTVIITRTSSGFVPDAITIDKGDTVKFISTAGQPFWPASNNHPTHTLYPAFDPKQPIPADQSWSFTFLSPGVWGFHDHLHSEVTGTITVRGAFGETVAQCLSTRDPNALNAVCWEADVKSLIEKKGLDAAFDYVREQYATNIEFKRNCHDVMHYVGSFAYQKFLSSGIITDRPETAYCGYGFYHGFIEAMQAANGRTHYEDVRNFCDGVTEKGGMAVGGPCYHGIGHALFDSVDGSLYGNAPAMIKDALSSCEAALPGDARAAERVQCSSGVFNSFANAASAEVYDLKHTSLEPHAICDIQKPEYVQACYGEVGIGYIRDVHMTRQQALAFIEKLSPSSLRDYMLFSYFADEAKRAMAQFDGGPLAQACAALSADEQDSCIYGVVEGIREESSLEMARDYQFPFCESFTDASLKEYCVEKTFDITLGSTRNSPAYRSACSAIPGIDPARACQ